MIVIQTMYKYQVNWTMEALKELNETAAGVDSESSLRSF